MEIHNSFEHLPKIKNPVVTTGSFDGVHVGHSVIIRRLNKTARDIDGESVLVTFHPHPRKILYPETEGKKLLLINSQDEKKILLEQTGLDHLIIIPFTKEFAKVGCEEFVEEYLYKKLGARKIIIGYNHQFGFNREGNFDYLFRLSRSLNFDVEEIPEQDIHNESVSSTKIRKALKEGNIQRANAYLDHYYMIKGKATYHPERTEELGVEILKLNVSEEVKLIPADGVYAVNIHKNGNVLKGMFSVKNNRFDCPNNPEERELEFHCLDQSLRDSTTDLIIYFHKLMRKSKKYNDSESMKKQLRKDLENIEELIY